MAVKLVNELGIHVRDKHETDIVKTFLWMGAYCFSAYSMVWGLSWSWMYFMAECLCMAECIIHGHGCG